MRILIWGIGRTLERIWSGIEENHQIVGYIETKKSKEYYKGKKVYAATDTLDDYDVILVASQYGKAIYERCCNMKIDRDKLCFLKPIPPNIDIDRNLELAKKVLKPDWYDMVCAEFGRLEKDWVAEDADCYSRLNTHPTMQIQEEHYWPIYSDKVASAGSVNSYFWQDLWAAKKIFKNNPKVHYDIGSRVDGFIAHLLSFGMNVNLIDIRPLKEKVEGLDFTCADATNLDVFEDDSIESLSALCSLEHFGLGRYGDPIDPDACYKCFTAINRKVKSRGNIYIAVPVGKEHIEFNAHRVFYASTIVESFSDCELVEYSSTRGGEFEEKIDISKYDSDLSSMGSRFGLFHFVKR